MAINPHELKSYAKEIALYDVEKVDDPAYPGVREYVLRKPGGTPLRIDGQAARMRDGMPISNATLLFGRLLKDAAASVQAGSLGAYLKDFKARGGKGTMWTAKDDYYRGLAWNVWFRRELGLDDAGVILVASRLDERIDVVCMDVQIERGRKEGLLPEGWVDVEYLSEEILAAMPEELCDVMEEVPGDWSVSDAVRLAAERSVPADDMKVLEWLGTIEGASALEDAINEGFVQTRHALVDFDILDSTRKVMGRSAYERLNEKSYLYYMVVALDVHQKNGAGAVSRECVLDLHREAHEGLYEPLVQVREAEEIAFAQDMRGPRKSFMSQDQCALYRMQVLQEKRKEKAGKVPERAKAAATPDSQEKSARRKAAAKVAENYDKHQAKSRK